MKAPMRATKKPVTIEFIEWTGSNPRAVCEFMNGISAHGYMDTETDNFYIDHNQVGGGLVIKTSEGDMYASIGDMIIKEPFDKDRMFYPCKPDIFALTYDVDKDANNLD
ncbi:MAG: hypothetical protein JKY50_00780 [Oleispira sp.]|nr:hypothetical protein [Oleispira sp.]